MGRFIFLLYPDREQSSLETPHDVGTATSWNPSTTL